VKQSNYVLRTLNEHVRSRVQLDQNKINKLYAKIKDWTKSCDLLKWKEWNHKKN